MIKKISISIVSLVVIVLLASYIFYLNFRSEALHALASGSQIADTPLGAIEYQIIGDSGPVMLFLHGTPGGYDQAPATPGFRVLAPSRPGYLRTSVELGSSPAAQANAYLALLDSLHIDSVIVMGASGGGPSALAFASLYPERTLALIAMEAVSQTIVLGGDQPGLPFFMKFDFVMWASLSLMSNLMGPEDIVSLMIPNAANQQLILGDGEKMGRLKAMLWTAWPITQRQQGFDNDMSEFSSLALANTQISAPTLIIHGTEDINVPFTQSELLARQIPGAILHVINGGDHMMPFSHSEEVGIAIDQFLLRLNINGGKDVHSFKPHF